MKFSIDLSCSPPVLQNNKYSNRSYSDVTSSNEFYEHLAGTQFFHGFCKKKASTEITHNPRNLGDMPKLISIDATL